MVERRISLNVASQIPLHIRMVGRNSEAGTRESFCSIFPGRLIIGIVVIIALFYPTLWSKSS